LRIHKPEFASKSAPERLVAPKMLELWKEKVVFDILPTNTTPAIGEPHPTLTFEFFKSLR
jgi:hypothetical protein